MKCRASSMSDTIKKEVENKTKQNFNIFAKRLFVCFAAAMLDHNLCPNTVHKVANMAYQRMEAVREHRISFDDLEKQIWDEGKIQFYFSNIKYNSVDEKRVLDIIEHHKQGYYTANECILKIEREIKNSKEPKASPEALPKVSPEVSAKIISEELAKLISPKIKEQIEREVKQ